jgi:hypothetical protein
VPLSPPRHYFLSVRSVYSSQHPVLKHFQAAFLSSGMKRSFTAIHTKGKTTALGFTSRPTSVLPPNVTSVICLTVWRCSPLRQHHRHITTGDVSHPVTGITDFMNLSSLFRCLRKTAKHVVYVCVSARPPVSNNSAPTGQIFMKFDICEFYENQARNSIVIKICRE